MATPPQVVPSSRYGVLTAFTRRLLRSTSAKPVRSLHEELSRGPVAVAIAITLLGFVAAGLWLSYDAIAERKRLIRAFAKSAKNDLQVRQRQVFARLKDMRDGIATSPAGTAGPGQRSFGVRSDKGGLDGELFSLVVLIDHEGRVLESIAGGLPPERLAALSGTDGDTQLFGAAAKALRGQLSKGEPGALPVQRLHGLNSLLNRSLGEGCSAPNPHVTCLDQSALYDFVVALPVSAVPPASGGAVPAALVAAVSWQPFQLLLDDIAEQSRQIGLSSGYAYLTQPDGDTIIGHKLRSPVDNLYGDSISEKHKLPHLTHQLLHAPDTVYYYKFRKAKYAALQHIEPPDPRLKDSLEWRLGVGVDVWPDMTTAPLRGSALILLFGVLVTASVHLTTREVAKRASMSVTDLTDLVKKAEQNEFTLVGAGGSHEELSALHDAIGRLIASLRGELSFRPLQNPYIVGNPIQDGSMFFGRMADVAWIEEHLRLPGNELILLAGQRRIGKTSLLHAVRRLGPTWTTCPFFFDSQELLHDVHSDNSFYDALVARMLEQWPAACPNVAPPQIAIHAGQALAVTKVLKYVSTATQRSPVLLFDELEVLQQKLTPDGLTPAVFAFLASLIDSANVSVSIVISGSQVPDRSPSGPFGHLLAKAVRRRIGLLSPEEARGILLEPLKGHVQYDDTAIAGILRFTGAHPYYTQDACHRLVHVLNRRRARRVGEEVVTEVVNRVLDNPPPQLDHAWHQLPERARLLAIAVASALPEADGRIDLMNACNNLPLDVREPFLGARHELNKARDVLLQRDWMDRDATAGYRFRIDMYRLWLRREHPSSMLADFG